MDLQVGGSSPLTHPICYPHANQGIVLTTKLARMGDFSSVEGSIPQFTPEETLAYISYIQKYASQQPRTYWVTIPFYTVIKDHKQQFRFGYRPEDLAHIDTIEQKAWKKHEVYLERLEQFPLDKAEYYARMKEIHGISTVREIAKITGGDWSYVAKTMRVLELPDPIKNYLRSNKNNPEIVKFFHLRRLLDIVYQKEERLQLGHFRELIEEFEVSSYEDIMYKSN